MRSTTHCLTSTRTTPSTKPPEYEASLDLRGEIIAGELPRRQLRLVQAWTELHAEELRADWELAVNEKQLNPIDPLR